MAAAPTQGLAQPGNVGPTDPKVQLGRMFPREKTDALPTPAPDAFLGK
jgi:hypothetical protein